MKKMHVCLQINKKYCAHQECAQQLQESFPNAYYLKHIMQGKFLVNTVGVYIYKYGDWKNT